VRDAPLTTERCSSGPEFDARFPSRERLYAYEGGALFGAERSDWYWLISVFTADESPDNVALYQFPHVAAAEAWHDRPCSHAAGLPLRERIRRDREL
jgi:hypothetical protein